MSFTATGLEVTSRGGSLGGLKVSLMLLMRERYHGSSTSETSSRDKWSSAFDKNGLLGCDRSAILIHQLSGRAAVYSLLDAHGDHVVTAFGNSAGTELRLQCSTLFPAASCKNNEIGPSFVPSNANPRIPNLELNENFTIRAYPR